VPGHNGQRAHQQRAAAGGEAGPLCGGLPCGRGGAAAPVLPHACVFRDARSHASQMRGCLSAAVGVMDGG